MSVGKMYTVFKAGTEEMPSFTTTHDTGEGEYYIRNSIMPKDRTRAI